MGYAKQLTAQDGNVYFSSKTCVYRPGLTFPYNMPF